MQFFLFIIIVSWIFYTKKREFKVHNFSNRKKYFQFFTWNSCFSYENRIHKILMKNMCEIFRNIWFFVLRIIINKFSSLDEINYWIKERFLKQTTHTTRVEKDLRLFQCSSRNRFQWNQADEINHNQIFFFKKKRVFWNQ